MNLKFKQLIKEAIIEALTEYTNGSIMVMSEGTGEDTSGETDGKPNGETNGKPNGDTDNKRPSEETSGGGAHNGKPKPDVGIGVFGLR